MSFLKAAVVIIGALCCSSKVESNPTSSYVDHEFESGKLIVGPNHVEDTSVVYALCEGNRERTSSCSIHFYSDVFNGYEPVVCGLNIPTQLPDGVVEVLEVNILGQNKATLTWREMDLDYPRFGQIGVATVKFPNCAVSNVTVQNQNRDDMKPQIFVLPAYNSYDVAYQDPVKCGHSFCKLTVNRGEYGRLKTWFPSTYLVHALENIEDHENKLLLTVGESSRDRGVASVVLLSGSKHRLLGSYGNVDNFGWSTSNGYASFCTHSFCQQYNHDGGSKKVKRLNLSTNPVHYATLYNLPRREHLALICDGSSSDYRVVQIDVNGYEEYSYNVDELNCWQKPEVLTSKIYLKNTGEYCLSLFYSEQEYTTSARFSSYCFSL